MSDTKSTESKPAVAAKPAPQLAPASESGDAAVHNLLARRQVLVMNGMDVSEIDSALEELGLTAK